MIQHRNATSRKVSGNIRVARMLAPLSAGGLVEPVTSLIIMTLENRGVQTGPCDDCRAAIDLLLFKDNFPIAK
jgi:hypothetical protein